MQKYDVVVIGAGPGGYIAAIRAAQLGLTVACIDNQRYGDRYSLGGTCLNVGCIPSKALLQSSENFAQISHEFAIHGISCDNPRIDIHKMLDRKNSIINKNSAGISFLFKKNKVIELHGTAKISKRNQDDSWLIEVHSEHNPAEYSAIHVIIATGSQPRMLPNVVIDNINILDNTGALALTQVPKHLCVIGAGVIGIELASVWQRLGSKITILEAADSFLAAADKDISAEMLKQLTKQQLNILTKVKLESITNTNAVKVDYMHNNTQYSLAADKLLIAIGRVPNIDKLNAAEVGLQITSNNSIAVDEYCRTNLTNIWAIGDVVRGNMLAHKASEEGMLVAELIAGQKPNLDYNTIPSVIYTNPEAAWVGKTEQQLLAENIPYKKGIANFMANGRALGLGNTVGFIKMLACKRTDRILGVHAIVPMVSELITEAVVAMEFMASSEDLARIIHAHPSLTEVMHEAALATDNRQLHG